MNPVITSYSIHYTKLYEEGKLFALGSLERFGHGVGEANVILLLVQGIDRSLLVSFVLSTDRQANGAVLAIHAHELGFNVVAYRQNP